MRRSILMLAFIFAMYSCGPIYPDDSETREVLSKSIAKESGEKLRLRDFKVSDMVKSEEDGVRKYRVEFDYSIEVTVKCYKVEELVLPLWYRDFTVLEKDPKEGAMLFFGSKVSAFSPGETISLNGFMVWEQTEKGWRPKSLDRATKK